MNVVVLVGRWDPAIKDDQLIQQIQAQLSISFVEEHAGYRFKRILNDLTTNNDLLFASQVPFMRVYARFGPDKALTVVEKEDLRNSQGSILVRNFTNLHPKLRLTAAEQELLIFAQEGATDGEIASLLNITTRAVKARWATIFSRVASIDPDLIPASVVKRNRNGRGPQKRHRVLAYVRKHPEELRPYAFKERDTTHDHQSPTSRISAMDERMRFL